MAEKNKPTEALTAGLDARIQASKRLLEDLHPLITFYLETHSNSTARQIATAISRPE